MLEYDIGLDGEGGKGRRVVKEEYGHVEGLCAITLREPCGKCIVR